MKYYELCFCICHIVFVKFVNLEALLVLIEFCEYCVLVMFINLEVLLVWNVSFDYLNLRIHNL